jgi:hypothetical protein
MVTFVALLIISGFDKPAKIDTVSSDGNRTLSCWLYPGFMVKQLDAHEKGAERLSFVRYSGGAPTCDRTIAVGVEKVLDDWGGYYAGALGDLVVFNGDDGWNGGMGFAIYDTTTGNQVFKDARLGDMTSKDNVLLYKRVTNLGCNASADKNCVAKGMKVAATKKDLGPICKKGYSTWLSKFQASVAKIDAPCDATCKKERKAQLESFRTSPSVIAYEVSVDRNGFAITPKTNNLDCWPAN